MNRTIIFTSMFIATLTGLAHSAADRSATGTIMSPRQRNLEALVDEAMLSHWEIDRDLDKLVNLPTGKGNAAEYYARLEACYPNEREKDKLTVNPHGKGVQIILAAARIRDCRLTPKYYPNMETGTSNQPDILVFQAYAKALLKYAKILEQQEEYNQAAMALRAGLVWGWHLCRDRSNLVTLMLGLSIELQFARSYSRFLHRMLHFEKGKAADRYAEHTLKFMRRLVAKSQVFLGDFKNFNCIYSTIKIAKYDKDYLWRQEAVLRLAVLRHGAPERGNKNVVNDKNLQRLATDTLIHVAENDPKPWIRKLAQWSIQHVTHENFQNMRHKSLLSSVGMKQEKEEKESSKNDSP